MDVRVDDFADESLAGAKGGKVAMKDGEEGGGGEQAERGDGTKCYRNLQVLMRLFDDKVSSPSFTLLQNLE